jgi:hypothetical protein
VVRPALALLVLVTSSCAGEDVTEVFACYSVDPALVVPGGSVSVCAVSEPDGRVLFGCDGSPIGGLDLGLQTQGYVRSRADALRIELAADVPGTGAIRQTAQVEFQPDRVVDLSLRIESACAARVCPAAQTCVGGACLPEAINGECLATHGRPAPEGCLDLRVTRGCSGEPRDSGPPAS